MDTRTVEKSVERTGRDTWLLFGVPAALLFVVSWVCVLNDAAGALSLGFLDSTVQAIARGGDRWLQPPYLRDSWYFAGSTFLLLLCAIFGSSGQSRRFVFGGLLALCFGVAAELFLLTHRTEFAEIFAALAGVAIVVASFERASADPVESASRRLGGLELAVYCILVASAVLMRTYALNRHFDFFEGELSPYSAAATSPWGVFEANAGHRGPWAPLGLLYFVPIYLTTSLLVTTVLALRLSSVWVGVLTIPIMYILARRLAGPVAAAVAIAFFALDPMHIGWDRTDVHPHGVTTWPTVLLCLAVLNMLRTRRHRDFLVVSLLMGLVWHQYPSGQTAVLLPWTVFLLAVLFDRGFLRACWLKSTWLLFGTGLWFAGLPVCTYLGTGQWYFINPFTQTSVRTTWGNLPKDAPWLDSLVFLFSYWAKNVAEFFEAVYYQARSLHPQDFIPHVTGYSARSAPWAEAAVGGVAILYFLLTLRRARSKILLSWIAVSILPTVLSHSPFPKRASTFFPALGCAAAVLIADLVTVARPSARTRKILLAFGAGTFGIAFVVTVASWLSNTRWRFHEPEEVEVTAYLASELRPGTIMIVDGWDGYMENKFTYLMMDALTSPQTRPNAWIMFDSRFHNWQRTLADPVQILSSLTEPNWAYRWTRLAQQREESANSTGWRRVVYVIQERAREGGPEYNLNEIPLTREACRNGRERRFVPIQHLTHAVTVFSCDLPDSP